MSDESIVDLVKKHQAQAGTSPAEPMSGGVAQKAAVMSEAMPADRQSEEVLERLLQNVTAKLTWMVVPLPSQGLLYPEGQKAVEIRPLTFDDERVLKSVTATKNPEAVIEKLLRSCVRGIDASELTPADRLYVLFRIRGISYGDKYPVEHECTNCGSSSKLDLSIESLETTNLTQQHMEFTLPDSQQDVIIKLPRVQDAHLYDNLEAMHDNMALFVYSVGGVTDKTIVEAFIRKTTVRDVDTLRSRIFDADYGMENHFFYSCNSCGTRNRVNIELNASFFTAS